MILNSIRASLVGAGTSALALVGDAISESTHITLGGAVAAGLLVAGWAYWLGKEFQHIADRDAAVKEHLSLLEAREIERHSDLAKKLDGLPCHPKCPEKR
jgi:hypothetical protein